MAASSESKSATVHFGNVKAETHEGQHLFEVEVRLDEFDPNMVRVELYADGLAVGTAVCQEMKILRTCAGMSDCFIYGAVASAARPASDYTARVIPHRNGVAIPLEDARIRWQR